MANFASLECLERGDYGQFLVIVVDVVKDGIMGKFCLFWSIVEEIMRKFG